MCQVGVWAFSDTGSRDVSMIFPEEKPQKKLLANVGMYVLSPEVNKYIKTSKTFGMDELIKRLLKLRKKICIFPIKEDEWIDTGNWNNYFEAIKK